MGFRVPAACALCTYCVVACTDRVSSKQLCSLMKPRLPFPFIFPDDSKKKIKKCSSATVQNKIAHFPKTKRRNKNVQEAAPHLGERFIQVAAALLLNFLIPIAVLPRSNTMSGPKSRIISEETSVSFFEWASRQPSFSASTSQTHSLLVSHSNSYENHKHGRNS